MAINSYTGLPGSGKSYTVVERVILPALEKGKRVWTNIPMELDALASMHYDGELTQFATDDIVNNPDWFQDEFDAGAIIVIDECWRFWPSGMRASNMLEGHKSFFAEHRHMVGSDGYSTEVVLVTQNNSQIAATLRDLIEYTYVTTKLKTVGLDKTYRVDIYERGVTGQKPPANARIRQFGGSYKPDIYRFYKSQTMSDTESHGDESSTDDNYNIWKSKAVLVALPIFMLLMMSFVYYGANTVIDQYSQPEATKIHINTDEFEEGKQTHGIRSGTKNDAKIQQAKKDSSELMEAILQDAKLYISYNNGNWPSIDYRITIEADHLKSVVSINQLKSLGFHVTALGQCMVMLRSPESITRVQCQPSEPRMTDENPLQAIDVI